MKAKPISWYLGTRQGLILEPMRELVRVER